MATLELISARRGSPLCCLQGGDAVGINAVAMLTAPNALPAFSVRGESLLALRLLFEDRADAWLMEHRSLPAFGHHVSAWRHETVGYGWTPSKSRILSGKHQAQGSSCRRFLIRHAIAACRGARSRPNVDGFLDVDVPALGRYSHAMRTLMVGRLSR